MNIIAQLFGFAALTDSIFIYQQTKRQNILKLKVLQDLFWMIHYIILSAWSAAATSGICMLRGGVFYNNDKGIFKSRVWLYLFIAFYALSAVMTWQDVFSLCPALASSISAVAFWMKNPRHTKMLQIAASMSTLLYNITHSHSPAVYVGLTITVTSAVVSLIRTRKMGEAKEETE